MPYWTLDALLMLALETLLHKSFIKNHFQNPGVVPLSQENVDNRPSLFDYGLDNSYNDLIDNFDPYLEYGKRYQNRTAFEDAFYG